MDGQNVCLVRFYVLLVVDASNLLIFPTFRVQGLPSSYLPPAITGQKRPLGRYICRNITNGCEDGKRTGWAGRHSRTHGNGEGAPGRHHVPSESNANVVPWIPSSCNLGDGSRRHGRSMIDRRFRSTSRVCYTIRIRIRIRQWMIGRPFRMFYISK